MSEKTLNNGLFLRPVVNADPPIFFEQQQDPDANQMAAFTSRDPSDLLPIESARFMPAPPKIIRLLNAYWRNAYFVLLMK